MTAPAGAPVPEATPAFVDLQVHSTASDGALAPAAVVRAARDAGLVAIALTDHDTVDGVPEAQAEGAAVGVRVIAAVELSTMFEGEELHLLGLHLQDLAVLRDELAALRTDRVSRAERMVAVLNQHGIPVTMEAVLQEAAGGAVGRPHVARALMAGGWVREFRDAFDRWIGFGRPAYVTKAAFQVADAIALVHRAGGLAIWAHPGEAATPARVARLAQVGLDGVEALHPSHPPYLVTRLVATIEEAGLLPSGGSDWHGAPEGPRKLGGQLVPKVWLDWQDARVAERRAAHRAATVA